MSINMYYQDITNPFSAGKIRIIPFLIEAYYLILFDSALYYYIDYLLRGTVMCSQHFNGNHRSHEHTELQAYKDWICR